MKIVVYAICKNEEKFVDRWMDSMSEADEIVVLDTGSTDLSVSKLVERGAKVYSEKIEPWRFDVARNRSLELVDEDADICVCTDLDEVFHGGWRQLLENAWRDGVSQARYRYTWNFTPDGREGVVFWYEKVHTRHNFKWIYPVHEILKWTGEGTKGPTVTVEGMQLDHLADPTKSRAQYLPLLELSVSENPADDRNMHYLGREYMFRRRWNDCITTLKKHLAMPSAVWKDERAASMRFIAKSYYMLGNKDEAVLWYMRAICEAPHLREGYCDLAMLLYEQKNWAGVLYFCGQGLRITDRPKSYICEAEAWGSLPYDLTSYAYYKIGQLKESLDYAERACSIAPSDTRLQNNVKLLKSLIKSD